MMGFIFNWDRLLGALLGAGIAWCLLATLNQIFWLPQAREDERNKLAAEALQKTIQVIQSREKTNVEISAGDAASLCEYFGLRGNDKTECLRRLAETTAKR